MTTDHLSIRDEIAQHDAEVDALLKSIMAPAKPRVRKVVLTSPTGIVSKPRAKPATPGLKDENAPKPKRRTSPEARRAALERKQF